ncbi:2-phospho-L-lactate guanylyltransferase [Rathayibacter soli]|uniref:2-phospho-L-lactate guanylyltransferase n=1 Tax=Rathayibacter soli TaxID=3144168 RepID=UPI0027E41389|nr:2-phospho-L-lactate guanylyltransferase [Glaciibacter superstes]
MSAGPHWSVVIPFKGAPHAKSRFAENFDDARRAALAIALLTDTVRAVRAVAAVTRIIVVSNEPNVAEAILSEESGAPRLGTQQTGTQQTGTQQTGTQQAGTELIIVADPGGGLNAAVSHGIRQARNIDDRAFTAAMVGDVAALQPDDLAHALAESVALFHTGTALTLVADHDGTGTTMITAAPGAVIEPHFGVDSCAEHQAAGHVLLQLPAESSLRLDIDSAEDMQRVLSLDPGLGAATRRVLSSGLVARSPLAKVEAATVTALPPN